MLDDAEALQLVEFDPPWDTSLIHDEFSRKTF